MAEGAEAAARGLQSAVADQLDTLKSWKVSYWTPLVLGVMMMGDSWEVIIAGFAMPSLRHEWGLSAWQVGSILSSGFAGQFLGALLFGAVAERFGRLPVFNAAVAIMSLLSLACASAGDPVTFAVLRFVQGIGFGGASPVCASYVNELAPTASRGRYFLTFQFLMVAGFSLCAVVSSFVIPTLGWRAMFVIAAFPMLLSPLVLITLPESPRWLARRGRLEATNRALVKLGGSALSGRLDLGVKEEEAPKMRVGALLSSEIAWRTAVTCLLWFCTALVSNAFSAWSPTLFVDVFHLSTQQALRIAAWAGIGYGMTPLVFALLIDRTGRKPAGIAIAVVTLAATVALAAMDRSQPALSVMLIAVGWVSSGSSFVLLWPYTGEVFPTRFRSTALGLCSAIARGGSMLTPLVVAGVLSSTGSIGSVYATLAVPTLIVLLLWIFTAKEMARKPLDELG